ncbi:MAG: hypothetical protein ACK5JD_13235 [Mangrovibacterium sp.]
MTRKLISRLLLFAAVVISAVLFDVYHQGSAELAQAMSHRSQPAQSVSASPGFCVNQASTFRLINGADKLFSGLVFAGTRSNLLVQWNNHRAFYLLQAESTDRVDFFLLSSHFMKFNCCHQSCSDDSHPLA